jgi:glycosyltransferase involved in cell wall biosynthesis
MRRPVFIYLVNLVGGAEYMFLRRAESARRLGLDPVIVTVPGDMDAAYLRAAKVIHLDPRVFGRFAYTRRLGEELADELAAMLGPGPCHFEATGMPGFHVGAMAARRIPGSECLMHAIIPRMTPLRHPPSLKDLWRDPRRFWQGLRGRLPYPEIVALAESGRLLSVNQECVDTSAQQVGRPSLPAVIVPLSVGTLAGPDAPRGGFVLSACRLDGKMKAYVDGLIRSWPAILRARPGLRLKIVGDGPARATHAALAEALGVAGAVDFLGTLDNADLAGLYASADVFVGMGTAAIEASMHGAPVIIAVENEPACLTPGCFGDPALKGFGEKVPGQALAPAQALLEALLADDVRRDAVAERGRLFALRTHHPDACDERLADLLSAGFGAPVELPAPLMRPLQVLANFLMGRLARRPLARWASQG